MSLASGTRLGPYEIQSAIGAGGMGEVYKARDTRLDRTVAIKVLPRDVSGDPERRARFEREAKTIAGLNHPHICTLYDVGDYDGAMFLVMEHLAGQTLAERLEKGPLPVDQVLTIATEIADALSVAHRQGVIHRDLKPGNVMLTKGGAKLLDFGLAKLTGHGDQPAAAYAVSAVPTQAASLTGQGAIVGTLQYMAPEQLGGKAPDGRTDLWALGAILYEMVTGKRAFTGDSHVRLIGNIMEREPPPIASLQPLTPPALDRIVRSCLAKVPDDRPDTAHDVANELRWLREASRLGAATAVQPRRRTAVRVALLVAGALSLLAAGAGLMWLLRPSQSVAPTLRAVLAIGPAEELSAIGTGTGSMPTRGGSRTALAWAPSGQALVFVGRRAGVQQLYVRPLDATEARALAGTEGAQVPAVSPDGRWVAFWAGGVIKRVPFEGGPIAVLAPAVPVPPCGMAWDAGGQVFFSLRYGGVWAIPVDGKPVPVTTVAEGEVAHVLPSLLPGGRVLLYTVRKREWSWGDEEVVAQALPSGQPKILLKDAADARYLPTGHLVFLRRGVLYAVSFDAERLEPRGTPVAVLDTVAQALTGTASTNITGAGQYAISTTGTLAWVPSPVAAYPNRALVSVDRHGQASPLNAPLRSYGAGIRLAPGGGQLAVSIASLSDLSVWTLDIARGTLTPLVQGAEADAPIWTPDGQRLVFSWLKEGRRALAWQRVDGLTPLEVLMPEAANSPTAGREGIVLGYPSSWTSDGRQLAIPVGGDLAIASIENGQATARLLTQTPYTEYWPEFSPDGHWLVYGSDQSGRYEVYVQPYPGPGTRTRVSIDGGVAPAWRKNGRELFFVTPPDAAGRRSMMVVDFDPASPARTGTPRRLFGFGAEFNFSWSPVRAYDVAPDGQQFYVRQERPFPPPASVTHVNLVVNWFEELKAKVPPAR